MQQMIKENFQQKNNIQNASIKFEESLRRLIELEKCTETTVMKNVRDLLSKLNYQPDIFPLYDQSLQLEYSRSDGAYLEFEFYTDGKVKIFLISSDKHEYCKTINFDINEVSNIINNFVNHNNNNFVETFII